MQTAEQIEVKLFAEAVFKVTEISRFVARQILFRKVEANEAGVKIPIQ